MDICIEYIFIKIMNSSLSQMARARNISANFSSLSFRVNDLNMQANMLKNKVYLKKLYKIRMVKKHKSEKYFVDSLLLVL